MAHEFDGKRYETASGHQREWGVGLISDLGLTGAERVLDLGCGDGGLTSQIAELVPGGCVLGIDASQGMIDAARPKQCDNLQFLAMDIDEMGFENEFDVVFSNAALHWVKDHCLLLRNVKRALRPSGRIRFQFAGEGNCSSLYFVLRDAMEQELFSEFFTDFVWPWFMPAVEAYEELARSAGLHDVRVWGENRDRLFPDAEAMIRWIDQPSLVPFLSKVAEPAKGQFREFVVDGMIRRTRQEDGRCFETFRRINVSAR